MISALSSVYAGMTGAEVWAAGKHRCHQGPEEVDKKGGVLASDWLAEVQHWTACHALPGVRKGYAEDISATSCGEKGFERKALDKKILVTLVPFQFDNHKSVKDVQRFLEKLSVKAQAMFAQ